MRVSSENENSVCVRERPLFLLTLFQRAHFHRNLVAQLYEPGYVLLYKYFSCYLLLFGACRLCTFLSRQTEGKIYLIVQAHNIYKYTIQRSHTAKCFANTKPFLSVDKVSRSRKVLRNCWGSSGAYSLFRLIIITTLFPVARCVYILQLKRNSFEHIRRILRIIFIFSISFKRREQKMCTFFEQFSLSQWYVHRFD